MQLEIDKQTVKEYLTTLNELKSLGPDELQPRILKELAEDITTIYSFLEIMEDRRCVG